MLPAVVEKIAFTSDVMEETRLKPWWERLRSHCVGTMIITALLIQYFDIGADGIHCVPSNQSISLSSAGSIYVNFFCYHQLPWHERYIGSITTAFSLLIYLCYSIWLMIPLVRSKFDILRNADNILRDVNHLPEKVEYLALRSPFDSCEIHGETNTEKRTGNEEKEKIRKFCWDFWEKSSGKKLSIYYLIRNVAAMLLMILPSYSTICFLLLSKDTFHCKNKELANLGYDFKCLNDIRSTILPYFVVFGIAMIIQFFGSAILVVLSLFMMRRNKFFLIFGNHSNKLHPMTVKFLEYKTEILLSIMENFIPEAVKKCDINYLKLYLKIAESGERYREAYEYVQRTVEDHINSDSFKHRSVLPCVHHSSLVLFCFEQKMFELFVKIHSVAILTQQDYKSYECGCNFLEFDLSKEAKEPFTDITLAQYLLNVQQDPTVMKHVFYWAKKNSYEKFDSISNHVEGAIGGGCTMFDSHTIELMVRVNDVIGILKQADTLGHVANDQGAGYGWWWTWWWTWWSNR